MSGHQTARLSPKEIQKYISSAAHLYHRGQSHTESSVRPEAIKDLFPSYRIVFVFPWQSGNKKQNFFAVFTSPEDAAQARHEHKDQSWSIEPIDKTKRERLHDLLQHVTVPKPRRKQHRHENFAMKNNTFSLSPPPPGFSSPPTVMNTTGNHCPESTLANPWSRASLKRSAQDAFESSSELDNPSKRRSTIASSIDVPPSAVLAAREPQREPSSLASASEEIGRLRAEFAHVRNQYVAEAIEPEMRILTITPVQERLARRASNPGPVFRYPPVPNGTESSKDLDSRETGVQAGGQNFSGRAGPTLHELQRLLDEERRNRQSLESELQGAREQARESSASESRIQAENRSLTNYVVQVKVERKQFEDLTRERDQLREKVAKLEAAVTAGSTGLPGLAKTSSLPAFEEGVTLRDALVAETSRRVNAERARDEAIAAKRSLEGRIPAVIQLYQELELLAGRASTKPRGLTT